MKHIEIETCYEVVRHFSLESGQIKEIIPYGNGHINDTFLITIELDDKKTKRYILQRMNRDIFQNPKELIENIINVTSHLKEKVLERGGNPERETLHLMPTTDHKYYYIDENEDFWRIYLFIEGAVTYEKVEKPEHFYESAVSFGKFQGLLADFPADKLYESIPSFHDTKKRFEVLKKAIKEDKVGRVAMVQPEISFALEREETANILGELLANGELPLRVTHNDTKLNNIMMDEKTGKGICVIDLDTVMPGLSVNDFGDSIRFGASTGAEDEQDLSKISCNLELFELYFKGFMEGSKGRLTKKEVEMMPMGAKVMTFECGIRFLTDFLQGDTYFKIHRENHNLDRCRTQFKLVKDMEEKWEQMQAIVAKG